MNAEFNWWLLIVGLVIGAGLVWLVISDWSRREQDISDDERAMESAWIAHALSERGETVDAAAAEEVLALHRLYLRQTGGLSSPAGFDDPGDEDLETSEPDNTDDEPTASWADDATDTTDGVAAADDVAIGRPTAPDGPTAADVTDDTPVDQPAHDRQSVRMSPLSPRGTSGGFGSEPPG